MDSAKQPPDPAKQPSNPLRRSLWKNPVALLVLVMLLFVLPSLGRGNQASPLPLTSAVAAIEAGDVSSIEIDDASRTLRLTFTQDAAEEWLEQDETGSIVALPDSTAGAVAVFPVGYGPDLVELATANDVEVKAIEPKNPSMLAGILYSFLPLMVILGVFLFLARKSSSGLMGSFSKMPRGADSAKVPDARLADVAGLEEVVAEMREVVEYLHSPTKFEGLGGRIPHGFLLVGPPGTGKTMLARCVAGEAGVPFYALSGSDFVETFVGVGASRVRRVFDEARKVGRAIVFIDELDAVGRARGAGGFSAANEESERTLNALLVEMDGFQRNEAVIVLAATNRPEILDQALLRPGRFDRQILVPLPDRDARAKILSIHLADRPVEKDLDLAAFARRCVGCSGADLAFIVNEASLEASRQGANSVSLAHLEHAHAVSALGRERRSAAVSDKTRTLTAWHEAGHTVAALALDHVEDPVSVSIIPRGITGGATWLGGTDEGFVSRRFAVEQLQVIFAGRAGEERLVGDDYTSGAAGDLQQATALATKMVKEWGMGEQNLMFRSMDDKDANAEIERLLRTALDDVRVLLERNATLHIAITEALLEEETLDAARLAALRDEHLGAPRPDSPQKTPGVA